MSRLFRFVDHKFSCFYPAEKWTRRKLQPQYTYVLLTKKQLIVSFPVPRVRFVLGWCQYFFFGQSFSFRQNWVIFWELNWGNGYVDVYFFAFLFTDELSFRLSNELRKFKFRHQFHVPSLCVEIFLHVDGLKKFSCICYTGINCVNANNITF